MRAAVLHRQGQALEIADVELDAPAEREVLVRVEAAGVCHSDLHYMHGDLPCRVPIVLGHEGCGIVEEVGQQVARVSPGDRVVLLWRPRCGECRFCLAGRPALCTAGDLARAEGGLLDGTSRIRLGGEPVHHFLGVSCFAERCVVAEESVLPIPADIPSRVGAMVGCAAVTGVGAILNIVGSSPGRSVAVIGVGGVGLSCVVGARLIGAAPVIAVDRSDDRLALAAELGADVCIRAGAEDLAGALRQLDLHAVDWAVDAVGRPETLEQAIEILAPGGTAIAVGLGGRDARFTARINHLVQGDRGVRGCLYGSANTPLEIPRILELYQAGRLPLEKMLGREYLLDQVNEAYADLAQGTVGRAIIRPQSRPAAIHGVERTGARSLP